MDSDIYHRIKRITDKWDVSIGQIQPLYDYKKISAAIGFGQKLAEQILTDKLFNGQIIIEKLKTYKNRKEINMADTRITILGMSGAGKTCYLLGLYYKMGSGMKGWIYIKKVDTQSNYLLQ